MVRSPTHILEKGYIGYGWRKVNFSVHDSANSVIDSIKQQYEDGIGRKRKSVVRFFNLGAGDLVIVPISKAIIIGQVQGEKSFNLDFAKDYAANLVKVEWFRNKDGLLLRIPRKDLTSALETRLKIRTSNACLKQFKSEILTIVDDIQKNGAYQQQSQLLEQIEKAEKLFKEKLYTALCQGNNWLAAGGYGLELLLKELLMIEGYEANIQAKNQSSDIADVDIIAIRKDFLTETCLFIQAKHHKNISNEKGVKQLIEYEDFDDEGHYRKCLVTTASLSTAAKELALAHDIQVIEGWQLVDWIYNNIDQLSLSMKHRLGVINVPSMAV